jgi:hypothetical protein
MNAARESSDFETGNCCVPTPETQRTRDAPLVASNRCVSKFIDSVTENANWSNIVDCGGYNQSQRLSNRHKQVHFS